MTALIKYEAACRALAECKAVDEVKVWADKAAAMQAYGRMAKDKTLEVDAAEIRIRAERRLGELLAAQKAGPGLNKGAQGNPGGQGAKLVRSSETTTQTPTLAEAGISKDLSSRAQKLAAVPEAEFEAELAAKRERDREDGARVSARLEAAGERAMKGKPAEPIKPVDSAEVDSLREQIAELTTNLKETLADNESMARVFEADDKVKAALAEAKRYRELNRILEERIAGLMNEKNAAIRSAKSWQRKAEAAERAQA